MADKTLCMTVCNQQPN